MKKITTFIMALAVALGLLCTPVRAADMSSAAGAVTTASGSLNVRAGASTGSAVVATLKKGSHITLLSKSGTWWRVEYGKRQYGYCHANYITPIAGSPATVATNSGALNVRSGPGTSYTRIATLSKGETVIVLTTSSGWSRILYHGTKTGYVSAQYLSTGASGYSAVRLNVPSYKQNDSRWASVKLGSSGQTIAKIGCATTAIAMLESYRTGKTIYPDAMSKQLKYTSGGSVYWPAHYVTVTDTAGYLGAVYNLLQQGKPVLLGARNTAGGQHWVVITGYTGGSALRTDGFIINDPGSNTRTNLQQFLNLYPTLYKYFYY